MSNDYFCLIKEALISLKNNGIEYPRKSENLPFEVFIQLITNSDNIRITNKLINNLKLATGNKSSIKDKVILSAFMIIENYEDVLSGCTPDNVVISSAKNLCISLQSLINYSVSEITTNLLTSIIEKYLTFESDIND